MAKLACIQGSLPWDCIIYVYSCHNFSLLFVSFLGISSHCHIVCDVASYIRRSYTAQHLQHNNSATHPPKLCMRGLFSSNCFGSARCGSSLDWFHQHPSTICFAPRLIDPTANVHWECCRARRLAQLFVLTLQERKATARGHGASWRGAGGCCWRSSDKSVAYHDYGRYIEWWTFACLSVWGCASTTFL